MKIMLICTGNICRSAMAEGILKKLVKENQLEVEVFSCGIYAEDGDCATYNAIEASKYYDVDISKHRATNIRNSQIEEMDLILCATSAHRNMVTYMYPKLKNKIYTMKEYAQIDSNEENLDIEDPWSYDIEVYKNCISEINLCLEKTIQKIEV